MSVQLRVDDFLFTKNEEWISGRHTVDNFLRFMEVIPTRFLLGMIPMNLMCPVSFAEQQELNDRELWKQVRLIYPHTIQRKIVPAVHGYWHDETSQDEFEGYSVEEIKAFLVDGVKRIEYLTKMRPLVYMPPHNVVNPRTLVACRELGFEAVTGGPETWDGTPSLVRGMGMRYVPSLPPFEYGRSDELLERGAVEHLMRRHSEGDRVTLGLHWTWETNIGLDSLRMLMERLSDALGDFEI